MSVPAPQREIARAQKRRWSAEIIIVLALSLGQSAVYALVKFLDIATRGPISQAQAQLNQPSGTREYFDLTYQVLENLFALAPAALAIYLLWPRSSEGALEQEKKFSSNAVGGFKATGFRAIGFDASRPFRDVFGGIGLFIVIGLPSLGLYALGRWLGITAEIVPSSLNSYWWTVPVLIFSALRSGIVEEVIVVGFLVTRLEGMGWRLWSILVFSAILRGSYHIYQGIGPFLGNIAMGLLFAWLYTRFRRVTPLVLAHLFLNSTAFLFGPQLGFG